MTHDKGVGCSDRLGMFETDFGRVYVGPRANRLVQQIINTASGDGRQRATKDARRDLRALEEAICVMGELAFRAGIDAKEIFDPAPTTPEGRAAAQKWISDHRPTSAERRE